MLIICGAVLGLFVLIAYSCAVVAGRADEMASAWLAEKQ